MAKSLQEKIFFFLGLGFFFFPCYQDDNNLFSGDSLHPNCQGDEVQVKRFKMTPNQPISGIK